MFVKTRQREAALSAAAKTLGLFALLMAALFEGAAAARGLLKAGLSALSGREWVLLVLLAAACLGLLAAFFRPRVGGTTSIAAVVAFLAVNLLWGSAQSSWLESEGWVLGPILMAGVLFAFSRADSRRAAVGN